MLNTLLLSVEFLQKITPWDMNKLNELILRYQFSRVVNVSMTEPAERSLGIRYSVSFS
jgi:hypothetical protein